MASCKGSREKRTSPKICNLCETDLAIYYCQTCLCNICNICIVGHRRQTNMRNHEVISIGNTFNTVYCLVHPAKNITYFCDTCKAFMCADCDHQKHKTHKCNKIDKCQQELKDLCHDLAKQLQIPYDAITHMEANIGSISNDFKKQCKTVIKELDERKSRVSNLIGKVFIENNDKVNKEGDEIEKKFKNTKQSVAAFKSKFEQTVHSIPTVVFSGELNMIINCIQTMQQQTEEAHQLQKALDDISKRPLWKIAAESDLLNITTDITKQYLGVTNNYGSKPLDQCEVLEKYMRPVIQVIEDKCTSLEKKVADVESKNLNLTREKKMIEDKCTSLEKKVADIESKNQNLTGEKKMIEDKCISLEKKVADIEANNQDLTGEKKGAKPQPPFPPQGPKPQHPGPPQEELQRKMDEEEHQRMVDEYKHKRMVDEYEQRKKKKETHRWFGASAGCYSEGRIKSNEQPPPFREMTTKELKKNIRAYARLLGDPKTKKS